ELTRQGYIVLAPFTRSGGGRLHNPTPTTADELHRIHRAKIAMASIVVFVTDESRNLFPTESRALYFGESTREELHYAQSLGKSIAVVWMQRRGDNYELASGVLGEGCPE
ncbi:hypothetical protein, partial [Mycolicibacterium sp.]|uniref:hypothetical protein n=1 Tax=Mycolicibacterium sp. TaxID=2320850 RepID=UPI0037C5E7A3